MSIERPLENSVQNVTVTDQMIKRYDPMVLISPLSFQGFSLLVLRENIPGGGGYCHIWAIWVYAAVKGMVFKQFTLGQGI